MRTAWKNIRYRLEWLALKSATKLLPLLGQEWGRPSLLKLAMCERLPVNCRKIHKIFSNRYRVTL